MKQILITLLFAICFALSSCSLPQALSWSKEELTIINSASPLYVLSVDNDEDAAILRATSSDLSKKQLLSDTYPILCQKLIYTVTDPSQDGVGIAGPQIGLSRRIVAVQRFDKEGEPFEVYPNIRIIAKRGELVAGNEGCLSVPNRRGLVNRYQDIDISYSLVQNGIVRDTSETITGFTAVIFQHECDHLDGILYIDHLNPSALL